MFSVCKLPYKVENAKSGEALCRECKTKIDKGTLRIARLEESTTMRRDKENWYHVECFFVKHKPKSVDEIAGFNQMQNEEQQKLSKKVDQVIKAAMVVSCNDENENPLKRSQESQALKDFAVEYSKSNRAKCRHCDIKICKGEIRISKKFTDTEIAIKFGSENWWYHTLCFAKDRNSLMFFAGGDVLPGLKNLSEEDQQKVKEAIKPMDPEGLPIKKVKSDQDDDLEAVLFEQNDWYQRYKTELSQWFAKDIKTVLWFNGQVATKNKQRNLDLLADCLAFGALQRCPQCRKGQLLLDTFDYKCTGYLSSYSSCPWRSPRPPRTPLQLPATLASLLAGYEPITRERRFRPRPQPATSVKEEVSAPVPPLKNVQFFIYGRDLSNDKKEELKQRIFKMGGLVVAKPTETTAAVVSTKREVEKMSDKMAEIKKLNIEIVEESFLDLIDPENGDVKNSLSLIVANNIAGWGSDPFTRVPRDVIEGKPVETCGNNYAKVEPPPKQIIKADLAVCPSLAHEAQVYRDEGGPYAALLTIVDVKDGTNFCYRLQLLRNDEDDRHYVYTAWGDIGTEYKENVETFYDLENAMKKFKEVYFSKTYNLWEERHAFVKHPFKYEHIEEDYSRVSDIPEDYRSDLAAPVQSLMRLIFDVELLQASMAELQLDMDRMPLAKISAEQISAGYEVLGELLRYLVKGKVGNTKILDASNRFYNKIPHKFKGQPPLLNSIQIVREKLQLLDDLMEIDQFYKMKDTAMTGNILDDWYKKLNSDITPLDKSSEEYSLIEEYVRSTQAPTHWKYSIEEVFKVVRSGEAKRYKPFRKLHNRRLLWHGSRVTNFAGILSQGLRIAPAEAPVTGYMFGKGIYFADVVSKSANYCGTRPQRPTGLLLLCEVALGNMKECTTEDPISRLPPGLQSLWGVGRSQPDPRRARALPDGTLVPLGPLIAEDRSTNLDYNEYVVYDPAQVNIKYLLQIKCNFLKNE